MKNALSDEELEDIEILRSIITIKIDESEDYYYKQALLDKIRPSLNDYDRYLILIKCKKQVYPIDKVLQILIHFDIHKQIVGQFSQQFDNLP